MSHAVLRAIVCMLVVVPTFALTQEYTDTEPYVVDPVKYPFIDYPANYQLNDNYPWETTTYPFDPNRSYTPAEQEAILQDEVGVTDGGLGWDEDGGIRDIAIAPATIPEAYVEDVPPPTETVPTDDGGTSLDGGSPDYDGGSPDYDGGSPDYDGGSPDYDGGVWADDGTMVAEGSLEAQSETFTRPYSRTESFGNPIFGSGYSIGVSITATPAAGTQAKMVQAIAEGRLSGTAFSYTRELIRGNASLSGQQGVSQSGTASVYAMGQQIWSTTLSGSFAPAPLNWSRHFFAASKHFMVGPIPVRVRALLSGGIRFSVSGEVGPTVARLNTTPGGWVNVIASATVDIFILRVGVTGSLSLINTNLPSLGELVWPSCTLDWRLKADLQLSAMYGTLQLYASLRYWWFGKTWRVTIASWPGTSRTWSLINQYGSRSLGTCLYQEPTASREGSRTSAARAR